MTRFFKAALGRADLALTVRFHDLPYAGAMLMVDGGMDEERVHPLGHRTIAITLDLHTHAVRALDDQAAERRQQALRRSI